MEWVKEPKNEFIHSSQLTFNTSVKTHNEKRVVSSIKLDPKTKNEIRSLSYTTYKKTNSKQIKYLNNKRVTRPEENKVEKGFGDIMPKHRQAMQN